MKYFFCGIGGIGMSAVALALKSKGHSVSGSDRSFDKNENQKMRKRLENKGIVIFPQDGSGVDKNTDFLVVSSAVEEHIPDVQKARSLKIKIKKRAQILADFINKNQGIAIAGTSGKTTITAMTAHILHTLGKNPTMINGGISVNTYNNEENSNLIEGTSPLYVAETDESDGTIELYKPYISVVSNISLDHKPLEELRPLFENFIKRTKYATILNADCPETQKLKIKKEKIKTFSFSDKTADFYVSDIHSNQNGSVFKINGEWGFLSVLGKHNIANAVASVAVCTLLGIEIRDALYALFSFKGTERRMQKTGHFVFDDYAHNPEKISASISTLTDDNQGRLFIIFQPHGFAPTKLMKDNLIQVFKEKVRKQDFILLPEIFYAGGTVEKTISSKDLTEALIPEKQAFFFEKREDIIPFITSRFKFGDKVLVMGARDTTLPLFSKEIADNLPKGTPPKQEFFVLGNVMDKNVALITPSSPLTPPLYLRTVQKYFNKRKTGVFVLPSFFSQDRFCAGTDEERAFEINMAFSHPLITTVMAFKGGYGSIRILDKIDYSLIKKNKKEFYGFSDTTALQLALYKKAGLSSVTGFYPKQDIPNKETTVPCQWSVETNISDKKEVKGTLIGGCLSLITSLIGTPYMPDLKNCILFIEDVREEPYKIDKMLSQLYLAGHLSHLKALVFGKFEKCEAKDKNDGTIKDVIKEWQKKLSPVPVVWGLNYGHIMQTSLLPIGKKAVLSFKEKKLSTES